MDILIIEDDNILSSYIASELQKNGHNTIVTDSATEAINKSLANKYDIVILDLLLKEEHGEKFVRYVRKKNIKIPIIVLSSLTNIASKVELLKAGVDDYMTKPFDIKELIARIEALHRRSLIISNKSKEKYVELIFVWDENKVIREGKQIFLTKKECELLKLLVINKNNVVKSEDLLNQIWNVGQGYHSNILQSLIRHLRNRIDDDFDNKLIKNIHGIGYMIQLHKEK